MPPLRTPGIVLALGTQVFSSACVGAIGDSSDPQKTNAAPGDPSGGGMPGAAACEAGQLLAPRLVRLASSELRDHVRGALPGVDEMLIQDIALQADHVAPIAERVIGSADFSAFYHAAFSVADAYATTSAEAATCRTGSADTCLSQVVNAAVTRLYRRAPTAEEWSQATASFQSLLGSQGAVSAASAVIAGALLAPQTIFHVEGVNSGAGGKGKVSRSMALELARFAFTGRAPQPEETKTLEGLTDDEFPGALGKLVASWTQAAEFRERGLDFSEDRFGVQHMAELSRSDPAFTSQIKTALTGEFREYVGESLFSPSGSFSALFTKSPSRVFPGLESLYDAESSSRRKGILGLASLLTARAAPDASSPVKRGIMVRVDLLCESVPPPIAGASFDKVMVTPDMQTRERYEALAAIPLCTSCHQTINPPGYLFEEFDQLGRHRNTEKGRPINAKGTLPPPFDGQPYPGVTGWDGVVPLADWMSTSPEARICFAAHFVNYVMSEPIPGGASNCLLPEITTRFLQSGRLDELSADLVSSDLFLDRSSQGAP
jgi:Protein of unknown function (DUF1588)